MDCQRTRSKLIPYFDGDLTDRERDALEQHVAQCYGCKEELDDLDRFFGLCRESVVHPNPQNRFASIRAELRAEPKTETAAPFIYRWTVGRALVGLAAAATVLIVAWSAVPAVEGAAKAFSVFDVTGYVERAEAGQPVRVPAVYQPFIERTLELGKHQDHPARTDETGHEDLNRDAPEPMEPAEPAPDPTSRATPCFSTAVYA